MGDYQLHAETNDKPKFTLRNFTPQKIFGRSSSPRDDAARNNNDGGDANDAASRQAVDLEMPNVTTLINSNKGMTGDGGTAYPDAAIGNDNLDNTGNTATDNLDNPESNNPPHLSVKSLDSASLDSRYKFVKLRNKRKRRKKDSNNNNTTDEEKLDTYSGVFLPCLAQIVGVIFFLRLPTITGQAGVIGTSAIVVICVISTFITSLSLSAIASNGTIQAGGPYYIISRTLGVEIGGALGMLFYLGTTLGASMHVMGAVETLVHRKNYAYVAGSMGVLTALLHSIPSQVWSLLLMLVIAKIVSVGSRYVTGAANFFLAAVGLSIVSILLGTILFAAGWYNGNLSEEERVFHDNWYPNYSPDPKTGVTPTFWNLLSIFYPATTGILAGTNRSGKLATPNQSIPIGTISAIVVTTILYLTQVWLIGSVVSHETLIFNKLVLASVAFPSQLMAKIGMVTSCIGAALQCMAGAPQLLGAIAKDEAIPLLKFLTRKKKSSKELRNSPKSPWSQVHLSLSASFQTQNDREDSSVASEKSADVAHENSVRAVWFTWAIASLGTLLGNIDRITPILTMFYLMMYGGINLCCFLLAWVDSPGFRPQFRWFSRKTALFGFFWCSLLGELML